MSGLYVMLWECSHVYIIYTLSTLSQIQQLNTCSFYCKLLDNILKMQYKYHSVIENLLKTAAAQVDYK